MQEVALREYAQLRSGAPGTVFFLEPIPTTGTSEPPPGPPGAGGGGGGPGNVLHRFELKNRKAAAFAQGVAQYVVSADGRKLLYRTPGGQGALFLVTFVRLTWVRLTTTS